MKVLIGYDSTEGAQEVLADLSRAGLPRDTEALIVTVRDTAWAPPPSVHELLAPADDVAAVPDAAEEAARHLREAFPGWAVHSEGLAGDPAGELTRRAKEWGADLIAVGSRGLGALGRLVLGSVSLKVVTEADRSVRVARRGAERDAPVRIVIGVDGSPDAERAVRAVGSRVWPEGTAVRLVAVDDRVAPAGVAGVLPTAAATIASSNEEAALAARRMAEWAEEALRVTGLETSIRTKAGEARRVLVEEALAWAADTIFVGSRGFSSKFERLRLGSVSAGVVTHAHCSVEVVRPAEGHREDSQGESSPAA
jgi:nucleotide-binding universal stress UspA family protein